MVLKLKQSEAKILIFLESAHPTLKYAQHMSLKIGMDYGYMLKQLRRLQYYKYIKSHRRENKIFYALTMRAPIKLAKEVLKWLNKTTLTK